MRFRQLEYQDRTLATLDAYIDHLTREKQRSDGIAELATDRSDLALPIPDFTREAWQAMQIEGSLPNSRTAIPFSPRTDGCGRPVPNAVLKVPTGGGKTWLAVSGVSRIMGRYLGRNTGFVLWIVPNDAIYRQTLKNLRDRQHPYRQALDRAAAGHVQIMEKTDRLGRSGRGNQPVRHAPDAAVGEQGKQGNPEDLPRPGQRSRLFPSRG